MEKKIKDLPPEDREALAVGMLFELMSGDKKSVLAFWDSNDDVFFRSTRRAIKRCIDESIEEDEKVLEAMKESILDYYNETGDKDAFGVLGNLNVVEGRT